MPKKKPVANVGTKIIAEYWKEHRRSGTVWGNPQETVEHARIRRWGPLHTYRTLAASNMLIHSVYQMGTIQNPSALIAEWRADLVKELDYRLSSRNTAGHTSVRESDLNELIAASLDLIEKAGGRLKDKTQRLATALDAFVI